MEKTLVLIKPDAVERGLSNAIISRLEERGLKLAAVRMLRMDKNLAERHYAPHREKPFFNNLVSYITSGPVVAAVFTADNAVEIARKAMGATDPAESGPGTIRGDLGIDIEKNSVHGSDSPQTALTEIALFFNKEELLD